MRRKVKFYNIVKGSGFIKVQGQKDVFFHKSACPVGVQLQENDEVEFNTTKTDRGDAAENIKIC